MDLPVPDEVHLSELKHYFVLLYHYKRLVAELALEESFYFEAKIHNPEQTLIKPVDIRVTMFEAGDYAGFSKALGLTRVQD